MSQRSWVGGAAAALLLACPFSASAQQAQQSDQAPAQAQSAQPNSFTDAQVRSFAAASAEIDPLNRQLASASAAQRTQIAGQIRGILERNNLDSDTYNAIASRAQSDRELASRIAALHPHQPSGGGASNS